MREREEMIAEIRRLRAEADRLAAMLAGAGRMLRLAATFIRCRAVRGAFIRAATEAERARCDRPTEASSGRA